MGCADAQVPIADTYGTDPTLPEPSPSLIPTIRIAPATGWQDGAMPTAGAADLVVQPFARDLDHPRWLYVLPNGDILVAETAAPKREDDGKGIRGWITGLAMKRAGSATPSADRITLLRDSDGDGLAETKNRSLKDSRRPSA